LPFVRQRDAAGQTPKQLHAKPVFEALDVLADGGLRNAEFQAGARETKMARRRLKGPQCIERQVRKLGPATHCSDPSFSYACPQN